jgi:hypothetical protein
MLLNVLALGLQVLEAEVVVGRLNTFIKQAYGFDHWVLILFMYLYQVPAVVEVVVVLVLLVLVVVVLVLMVYAIILQYLPMLL